MLKISKKALLQEVLKEVTNSKIKFSDLDEILDLVAEKVTNHIVNGDSVHIDRIGIFSTSLRNARNGINPKTGESMQLPAMKTIKFKAAKSMKDYIRGNR